MKKIAILGSTGSIGRQALEIIGSSGDLKAETLVTHSNVNLLIEQAKRHRPTSVGIIDERAVTSEALGKLKEFKVAVGDEAYDLCLDADEILFCIVGFDGLKALDRYIERGKQIALANKECLVSAGEILMKKAKEGQIIPVDSEHSAVWQCLRMGKRSDVKKIVLTASGGRYYRYERARLVGITPDEAIRHPNWKMGKKISVDSATMMNKALEILEARWLFGTTDIDYVIHPESIIHSFVMFKDGTLSALLSLPDMKLPISVALGYPNRVIGASPDFAFDKPLTFLDKREDVSFAPTLAYRCLEKGGSAGATLDAADEGAVKLFLDGKIAFTDIAELVRDELERAEIVKDPSLNDIIAIHDEIKNKVINNK